MCAIVDIGDKVLEKSRKVYIMVRKATEKNWDKEWYFSIGMHHTFSDFGQVNYANVEHIQWPGEKQVIEDASVLAKGDHIQCGRFHVSPHLLPLKKSILAGEWLDNTHLLKAEIPIGSIMAIGHNYRCSRILNGKIVYLPNRLILLEQLM